MRIATWIVAGALACVALTVPSQAEEAQTNPAAVENKGDEQLITELFVGEKLYLQDKGEFVLVLTPSFSRTPDAKETEISLEGIYGITDALQLTLEVPYVNVNPDQGRQQQGLGDVNLALNYNFIRGERFSAGLRSQFVFPSGKESRGLGGGEFVWEPQFLTATNVGDGQIYAGVGGEIGRLHTSFTYDLAGAYPIRPFVGVLEFSGAAGGGENSLYVAPGAYWVPSDKFQMGVGVPVGLIHGSDRYRIVFKVVYEF